MNTHNQTEMLGTELAMLRASVPAAIGAIVASADGRPLAGDLSGRDTRSTAAMAAALLGLGQRVGEELGSAALEEVTVRTGDGVVAVYSASRQAALVILAPSGVNMGLLNHYGRVSARVISSVMSGLSAREVVTPETTRPRSAPRPPDRDLNSGTEPPIERAQGPVSDPTTTAVEVPR